jgi:hypothetical protein
MLHPTPSWLCLHLRYGTQPTKHFARYGSASHDQSVHTKELSEFQLDASLEELGIAFEIESIQTPNAIGANEA